VRILRLILGVLASACARRSPSCAVCRICWRRHTLLRTFFWHALRAAALSTATRQTRTCQEFVA